MRICHYLCQSAALGRPGQPLAQAKNILVRFPFVDEIIGVTAHEREAPATWRFVVRSTSGFLFGQSGIKLRPAIAQLDGDLHGRALDLERKSLLGIARQRMVHDIAATFLKSNGQAESGPLGNTVRLAEILKRFYAPHDLLGSRS